MMESLAALGSPLDRTRLHVFVAGPGFGEGIAVALPGRGWLLVDGCRTAGEPTKDLPLLEAYSRWRNGEDDGVDWMILTHPHADHADGFAEVLGEVTPLNVGLMGLPPPGRHLLDEIRESGHMATLTEERVRQQQVLAAARAMESWEQSQGRAVVGLLDGSDLGLTTLQATVRAPDSVGGAALLKRGWPRVRERANELSLVIEIEYGATRVVLGGDLPRVRRGAGGKARAVATGWNSVMRSHSHLAAHHGLKTPHHASRDALHDALLSGTGDVAVWITPFSSSRLPSSEPGHGLDQILARRAAVMLTALPTRRDQQPVQVHPARISRSQYAALVSSPADTGFLAGATDTRPIRVDDALAPVWVTSFDHTGAMAGSWRGDVAMEIVP